MTPHIAADSGQTLEPLTRHKPDDIIGLLLQRAGKLALGDMERVLELQATQGLRFGEAALKLGLVTESDIQQALAKQFEYPYFIDHEASFGRELIAASDPYSQESETLRSVRGELQLRWFKDGRKTLALCSDTDIGGSSYLAANLAVLFAQMGRKVALIDANMRQPRLHQIFKLNHGVGLSDVLAGRTNAAQLHSIKPFQNLSVLLSGSPPPNPAELLARPAFSALIAELERTHDVILIDAPPSGCSSDFQAIAARAGGCLIATRCNVSRLSPLTDLKDRVAMAGAHVVGAVVLN